MKKTIWALLLAFAASSATGMAQDKLTREQILAMSTDELSELPLEDLMAAVETLGVSSVDELFALIMNKNVSSASKEEESTFTSPSQAPSSPARRYAPMACRPLRRPCASSPA